jgi:SAM-dependent methyltransferase
MHGLKNSINKRLYARRLSSARCATTWAGHYWQDEDGYRVVRCSQCRKFDTRRQQCSIGFGSPIRKCVSAAQEANLHSLAGKHLLEIGFGKHSIPRQLVTGAGGTWTGIEPMSPRSHEAALGKGGFGHVANIPFDDETFDIVVGIQTLEHWAEPLPDPDLETGHEKGLREIHRVLKTGGSIYFDAPIHLHGHEMFIMGDLEKIAALFDRSKWGDVHFEKWRQDYTPLPRYPTPEPDLGTWPQAVTSYGREMQDEIRDNASVWLLTVSASKL